MNKVQGYGLFQKGVGCAFQLWEGTLPVAGDTTYPIRVTE